MYLLSIIGITCVFTCITFSITFPYFFEKNWILVDFKKISGKILGLFGKGSLLFVRIIAVLLTF